MPSMEMPTGRAQRKGRGAASNDTGRFEIEKRIPFDDGWGTADEEPVLREREAGMYDVSRGTPGRAAK